MDVRSRTIKVWGRLSADEGQDMAFRRGTRRRPNPIRIRLSGLGLAAVLTLLLVALGAGPVAARTREPAHARTAPRTTAKAASANRGCVKSAASGKTKHSGARKPVRSPKFCAEPTAMGKPKKAKRKAKRAKQRASAPTASKSTDKPARAAGSVAASRAPSPATSRTTTAASQPGLATPSAATTPARPTVSASGSQGAAAGTDAGQDSPAPLSAGAPPFTAQTAEVTWDPTAEQQVEPDTLYLLDPSSESQLIPGQGGLISADGAAPWLPTSGVVEVPGRYRTGLQSVERSHGYLWMPLAGYLPTDQFTVEMWLEGTVPWSQISSNTPFSFQATYTDGINVTINQGTLSLNYAESQVLTGRTSASLTYNASSIGANQWTNVAFTYDAGTLSLYVNGAKAGTATGVTAPLVWSDQARQQGLTIGGYRGYGATQMAISDLRISRDARAPGVAEEVSDANDLTVNPDAPTGETVNQNLMGGLQTLTTPQTEAMSHGVLTGMRTDKLLTVTPIKAGAPDAAHPSQGVSGAFSYDWQVVDRTFAYYARLGLTPYISIDSTPQILGGSVAPFTGTKLTSSVSMHSPFSPQVPSDLTEWGEMVKDLVYHVTVEDGYHVPYWGVWNEPDGSAFWDGTLSNYEDMYAVTAEAVKAVNPNLQVGGPEADAWDTTWVQGLIDYCAINHVPLDFISWHYYSGNLGEIAQARAQVAQWATAAGIPVPKLIVGEWAWQVANLPVTGAAPFAQSNWFVNDWAATFAAESLMMMQTAGITQAYYTNPVAEGSAAGFLGTGLMSDTQPWATMNVFRMWSMLAPDIVSSSYTGTPGVMAQASTGSDGKLTVLVAFLRYRKDSAAPVAVHLPPAYDGATVRDYVVDASHSDAYDAGSAHADLEQLPSSTVSASGEHDVLVQPRSVHLLVISPKTG